MNFGQAIEALKNGQRVTRPGWNGKGMWLALQTPDANSKMTLPYIFMRTADEGFVPWLASQTDVLAEDWEFFPVDMVVEAPVGSAANAASFAVLWSKHNALGRLLSNANTRWDWKEQYRWLLATSLDALNTIEDATQEVENKAR